MVEKSSSPVIRHRHRRSSSSAKIVELLTSCPEISAIMPEVCAVEGASRGDGWSWLIKCEDYDIGSDHPRRHFGEGVGMALSSPAFGQIECSPLPTPGIQVDWSLRSELDRHARAMRKSDV